MCVSAPLNISRLRVDIINRYFPWMPDSTNPIVTASMENSSCKLFNPLEAVYIVCYNQITYRSSLFKGIHVWNLTKIQFIVFVMINSMAYGTRSSMHIHKDPLIIPILSRINPIPGIDTYLRSILILSIHLRLGLPKGIFPAGVPVKILKTLLLFFILATWPAHRPDYVRWTVTNYEVPHCEAFSTPHSHASWDQIFASGSCFQIPLPCVPPLM